MTFIAGIIIGLFIGAGVGLLAMSMCRISASQQSLTGKLLTEARRNTDK